MYKKEKIAVSYVYFVYVYLSLFLSTVNAYLTILIIDIIVFPYKCTDNRKPHQQDCYSFSTKLFRPKCHPY